MIKEKLKAMFTSPNTSFPKVRATSILNRKGTSPTHERAATV